jgi:hypothetical protein
VVRARSRHEISWCGLHFAWCSEYYDPSAASASSAGAAIAPSSSPRALFEVLKQDCAKEDGHSALIKGYKKKFKRLASDWLSTGRIGRAQYDEIVAVANSTSWRIWRPVVYVIPRQPIESAGRLISVPRGLRAAYGPELQITDLSPVEFDLIECQLA